MAVDREPTEPREPTPVEQCLEMQPLIQALRQRVDKRAREAAGGAGIPPGTTPLPVLRQRYRAVLAGFDQFATEQHILANLVAFEEALRDLELCMNCRAASGALLPEKERTAWRRYSITGCLFAAGGEDEDDEDKPVHGHPGFYYALSRDSYAQGRPVFRYHECPGGPAARMRELAERWRWKGESPS